MLCQTKTGDVMHTDASELSIEYRIVNVVATASYPHKLDIEDLGRKKGFLHDPEVYGGRCVYLRDQMIVGEVTIFPSGKMITVGARGVTDAVSNLTYASQRISRELGEENPPAPTVTVQNIVACVTLNQELDLEQLVVKKRGMIYEPETFPGIIYRDERLEGATLLIFASGKLVAAGLKDEKQMEAVKTIVAELRNSSR